MNRLGHLTPLDYIHCIMLNTKEKYGREKDILERDMNVTIDFVTPSPNATSQLKKTNKKQTNKNCVW